jgi:hypothetical protein
MSSQTVGPAIADITSKWELAQRMAGQAEAPEEALRSVFTGAIQQLEAIAKTQFETPIKGRVWDKVSGDKLKLLKETLILDVCDKILGSFNEEEVVAMLEEHRRTGFIKNMRYSAQVQVAFHFAQSSIINAVVEKAKSMTDDWIPKIVDAVRDEGIELPQPDKSE